MTTLNATAQIHLPRKFRARGMAAYLMVFALGMALGSGYWLAGMGSKLEFGFLRSGWLVGTQFCLDALLQNWHAERS